MTLYRLLTDLEFDGKVRNLYGHAMLPASTRLYPVMKAGTADAIKLNSYWQTKDRQINSRTSFNYLTAHEGGLVNQQYWPTTQLLTFQGNIVQGEQVNNDWVMVETNILGSQIIRDYTKQKWTNIHADGRLTPGKNWLFPAYFYLVSKNGFLYMEKHKVQEIG